MNLNGEPLDPEMLAAIRAARQRTMEPKRKVKRVQILSEAELEKIERTKLIKSQMQLF
jgi:ferredoxin-fold anticodon binding domain-containing protein